MYQDGAFMGRACSGVLDLRARGGSAIVGIWLNCHIASCDTHADRPTKERFWCFVCLQRLALNTAGFPDLVDAAEAGPEMYLTDSQVESAYLRVAPFRDSYAQAFDRLQYTVPIALESDIKRHALEIALALAAASAGSQALLEPEQLAGSAAVIDRRLVEYLEQGAIA